MCASGKTTYVEMWLLLNNDFKIFHLFHEIVANQSGYL